MQQTDGTWRIVFSKGYFLSLFYVIVIINSFILSLLTAPYFLFNTPNFTWGCYRPPDSFQCPQGGGTAHFEKHWFIWNSECRSTCAADGTYSIDNNYPEISIQLKFRQRPKHAKLEKIHKDYGINSYNYI